MNTGDRMEVIRELCSFEGRLAGTDAERRAANYLAKRLKKGGRRVEVEPTYVHPQWGLVHALHCALGVAGSLAALAEPAIGFAVVLLAATSMYLDLNTRFYLLRRVFFRRASQNVVSTGARPDAEARVFLCAHYDAGRTGYVYRPKAVERAARLRAALPFPIGPFRLLFWSLAVLLPILGARMAGVESELLSLLQIPPTLILIVGVFLLVDIELSGIIPAANDNASGVATVLAAASELDAAPPDNIDLVLLLTGAEECLQEGMHAFLRAHREELDPANTYFVNVDTVGRGNVRYETSAGWVVSYEMDPRLVELCEAIGAADRDSEDSYGAEALRRGIAGDSLPPRAAGFPSTGITCASGVNHATFTHTAEDTPERIEPESLERALRFVCELVRQLDRDVGRRLGTRANEEAKVA